MSNWNKLRAARIELTKETDKDRKWLLRSNARLKMEFGVEQPITHGPMNERAGKSARNHYARHNSDIAKVMARDNLEQLKLLPKLELM